MNEIEQQLEDIGIADEMTSTSSMIGICGKRVKLEVYTAEIIS